MLQPTNPPPSAPRMAVPAAGPPTAPAAGAGGNRAAGALRGVALFGVPLAVCAALARFGDAAGLAVFDVYRGLLFAHITVAVVTFGSTFALPVLQPMAARNGLPTLRFALEFARRLDEVIVTPGSALVIATGAGLLLSDVTGYRHDPPAWLLVGIGWVAVAAVLANGVQAPNLRRALRILDDTPPGTPPPAELASVARRMKLTGNLLAMSTVAILFLMVWKPDF